jgi:hypothetical protein
MKQYDASNVENWLPGNYFVHVDRAGTVRIWETETDSGGCLFLDTTARPPDTLIEAAA